MHDLAQLVLQHIGFFDKRLIYASKLSREQHMKNFWIYKSNLVTQQNLWGSIKEDQNWKGIFSSKYRQRINKKLNINSILIHTDLGNNFASGAVDGDIKPPNIILKMDKE